MTTPKRVARGDTSTTQPQDLRNDEDYLVELVCGSVPAVLTRGPERALRASIEYGWQDDAVCASADPEQWFPGKGGSVRLARAVCASCPVRRSCLASALLFAEDGIWAGTTPKHRRAGYRAIGNGVDVDQVLDELLTRYDRSGKQRRSRRWSGTVTAGDTIRGSAAA